MSLKLVFRFVHIMQIMASFNLSQKHKQEEVPGQTQNLLSER